MYSIPSIRGILQLVPQIPNSKAQIPNPANQNLVFGTRSEHEKFSDGKLLWLKQITGNPIPVVWAKYQISASAAVVGYFHRISWI